MTACILFEVIAALRHGADYLAGRTTGRVRFAAPGQQQLARLLVTSVAALGLGAGAVTAGGAALYSTTTATSAHADPPSIAGTSMDTPVATTKSVAGTRVTTSTHTTAWKLAETHLGDGQRWKEVLDLNRGTRLPDGTTFTQGTQTIPTGTTLRLPADATVTEEKKPVDAPKPTTRVVVTGDTLWDITEDELGDPFRYPEVFEASTDTLQPGGERLTDPDLIKPGWTITIPATRTAAPTDHRRARRVGQASQAEARGAHGADTGRARPRAVRRDARAADPSHQSAGGRPAETSDRPDVDAARTPTSTRTAPMNDSILNAPWFLSGLTGAGVLLAGGLYRGLRQRRAAQARHRRPGRAVATPGPELAGAEMTITAAGRMGEDPMTYIDEALRRLAGTTYANQGVMPAVAAVELTTDKPRTTAVTLHLSEPADLPAPWQPTPDRLHWHVPTSLDPEDFGELSDEADAPYPLLVTIGEGDDGACGCSTAKSSAPSPSPETPTAPATSPATSSPSSPSTPGRSASRSTASASPPRPNPSATASTTTPPPPRPPPPPPRHWPTPSPWSTAPPATTPTSPPAAPASTTTTSGPPACSSSTPPPIKLGSRRASPHSWNSSRPTPAAPPPRSCSPAQRPDTAGIHLHLTPEGRVVLEQAGLNLIAVGLTSEETSGVGLVYAQAEVLDDVPVPVDLDADDGWEAYADRSGALRREHTLPRATPDTELTEPTVTLLDASDSEYVKQAAVVPEDLDALAPKVPASLRREVEAHLPTLDRDLADWYDENSRRAKITLLGPLTVRTHGKPLAKNRPLYTELAAFLWLHRRTGVTREQVTTYFGTPTNRVRYRMSDLRAWLGTNPVTGRPYLPNSSDAPSTKSTGINVYQLDDVNGPLCDWGLFQCLRLRGETRGGAEGRADLQKALDLVAGPPCHHIREGGGEGLREAEDDMKRAIADVALTVTTHYLRDGDLVAAKAATEIALAAAPDEEATRLCLVQITILEGNRTEARRVLRDDICNRTDDDDAPPELNGRTKAIIRSHDEWTAG